MRPKISVVIIGKNEENNIDDCLKSVSGWAEEIIFVDDFSIDSTVERVKKEKIAVVFQRKMELEGKQRNFGAEKATNDWVMVLDCDERATDEVKKEIDDLFANRDEKEVAFWIPRKNYIGDYWLRWGGWFPAPHLKLYNRKYFRWKECVYDVVHPGVEFIISGYKKGRNLDNYFIHYNYRNIEDFIRKTNRLTTLDAIKWYLDDRRMPMIRAFYRFFDRFFRRYFRKKGYRDGYYGFMASFLSAFYELAAYSKYREILKKGYYLKENGITDEIIAKSKRNHIKD
jgi:glycosyltransferase involved in cell wall biosynthesis